VLPAQQVTPRPAPRVDLIDLRPDAAVALFDGHSLQGWTTTGGRYDGPARWTVEDGCLVGRTTEKGEGGLIYTARAYHSFDLELEVLMDHPFDSGVFLRMVDKAQGKKGVQVTLDHRPGGEIGAVYADGFLAHNEDGARHYKQGAWNHVRVRSVGRDFWVQAWVNGVQVTDYRLPKGAGGDYAETGRIGLQVHGGEPSKSAVRCKNIKLRELPVFDPDEFTFADDKMRATGDFVALFDGKDLAAWEAHGDDGEGFAVRDGVLALLCAGGAHDLRTKQDYEDFELRLDFKLARLANSGVFLRAARGTDNPAFSGCEVQIIDDHEWEHGTGTTLKAWQKTGGLYGAVAPGVAGALYPTGCWNTLEIRCQGPRVCTRLNGVTLYDVDTFMLHPEQGEPFPARARRGFIGLQRHAPGGEVSGDAFAWFRNVFVRTLP
jgi:hypothetical protein